MPIKEGDKVVFRFSGEEAMAKIRKAIKEAFKDALKEGKALRVVVTNKQGEVVLEIPVVAAVVGTACAPIVAILGSAVAFFVKCTVNIVKHEPEQKPAA